MGGTVSAFLLLGAHVGHAAKLVLAGEVLSKCGEVAEEVLAGRDEDLTGCGIAVGLNMDHELSHIRVRHCRETRLSVTSQSSGLRGREDRTDLDTRLP